MLTVNDNFYYLQPLFNAGLTMERFCVVMADVSMRLGNVIKLMTVETIQMNRTAHVNICFHAIEIFQEVDVG